MLKLHKNCRLYFFATVLAFIFTLFFMALCPLTIMTIVLLQHNPLNMEYVPLSFFFTNIVFFLILNSWLVKTSFTNLRRTRKCATRDRDGTRLVGEDEELNNFSMLQSFYTVIIPNNTKFRLMCPVSNVNLDASSSSEMSNIVASKRERTLPAFDTIVNQMDILQNNTRRKDTQPTEVWRLTIIYHLLLQLLFLGRVTTTGLSCRNNPPILESALKQKEYFQRV